MQRKSGKYLEHELECIHCGKEFDMNQVFVCKVNKKDEVVICNCIGCGHSIDKPEKEGGWIVVQRTLKGYEIPDYPK